MRPARNAKVILRHAPDYDPEGLEVIVQEGMAELGFFPHGRTLIKPNVVVAGDLFEHAHTRPELVEAVIGAARHRTPNADLAVGERCGITIPTRYAFKQAGFTKMLKRVGVPHHYFEETPQLEVRLSHPGRLRDSIYVPEPVAKADCFINCPKFKAHPWTTVTFSMKNYIGLQDDRHRMIDHDYALDRKVADLQHVIQPELIVIDAIIAGEGRMLTPKPKRLNLVIMGNNQVAVDAVCSRIIGVDPRDVAHIRLAAADGFGSLEPDSVELSGDVSFDAARERATGFDVGLVRVEKYFEGSKIKAYAGPPPGHDRSGYCYGGCPGAIEEAIEVLRLYDQECDAKMRPLHVVFGKYDGPLDVAYGEKVVFVGDCVEYRGSIGDQLVSIENLYRNRDTISPHAVEHDDIYAKLLSVMKKVRAARKQPYLRLEGCPVSVAELILVLSELGDVKNPYLSRENIIDFNQAYLSWRAGALRRRLAGQPYQVRGATDQGSARPELDGDAAN